MHINEIIVMEINGNPMFILNYVWQCFMYTHAMVVVTMSVFFARASGVVCVGCCCDSIFCMTQVRMHCQ